MNPLIYDAALAVGTCMVGVGAGLLWGAGAGLLVAGLLLCVLTVITARTFG